MKEGSSGFGVRMLGCKERGADIGVCVSTRLREEVGVGQRQKYQIRKREGKFKRVERNKGREGRRRGVGVGCAQSG